MVNTTDEVYEKIAKLLPADKPIKLLDLGCCTGLEYGAFMRLNPQTRVTGVKEEESLKLILREKSCKRVENLRLIYGDYFDVDLGANQFDAAIAMMEINEYTRKKKLALYKKVYESLSKNGMYIEWNYIGEEQEVTRGLGNVFSNQISFLLESGFQRVEKAWHGESTILVKAIK